MKKILAVLVSLIFIICIVSCNDTESTETGSEKDTDTVSGTDFPTDTGTQTETDTDTGTNTETQTDDPTGGNEDVGSHIEKIDYNVKVSEVVDLSAFTEENDFGKEGTSGNYTEYTGEIDVTKEASGGKTYNILKGGVYRIFGESSNGQIRVKTNSEDVILVLDNLSLSYEGEESAIYAEKCKSVTILTTDGSTNTVKDSVNNVKKGAIYVKSCNLELDGKGTLNVEGKYKSGIFCTKELTVKGGTYNITSNYHGIFGEQKLTIDGGTFQITSQKSGLKSGDYDEEFPLEAVKGSVVVNAGKTVINSKTNGISSYGTVYLNGGYIKITSETDGIDTTDETKINGGIIDITSLSNGIKSDADVYINGESYIKIISTDDGIDCRKAETDFTGVLYIKTNTDFAEDEQGTYILYEEQYYRVKPEKFVGSTFYSPVNSCKGIKAVESIDVKSGTIGIDSVEESIKADSINIKSGEVFLSSESDAVESLNATVIGENSKDLSLVVLNAYKGLKSSEITINNGFLSIITSSDSIDSDSIIINGGNINLFDDIEYNEGQLTINGGVIFCIATKDKPVEVSESSQKYLSVAIGERENYTSGSYLRVCSDETDQVVRLPKDYTKKLVLFYSSPDLVSGECQIQSGTYDGGMVHALVYSKGSFTTIEFYSYQID